MKKNNKQEVYNRNFLIKEAFSTSLCEKIAERMDIEHRKNKKAIWSEKDEQITNKETVAFFNLFDSVHFEYTKTAEEIFRKKLIPTTNYCRIYAKGAELLPHGDDYHCEHSVSINIKNSPEDNIWPFYVIVYPMKENGKTGRDKAKFMMKQGDLVFYYGPKQIHWRNELEFDKCYQLFLHWVDAEGPHANLGRSKKYHEYNKIQHK